MEEIILFEGNEVKVKTDQGETLINLVHTAKCCGLTQTGNSGKPKVRWRDVKKKLATISSSEEWFFNINTIIKNINDVDNRKSIYIPLQLATTLAYNCHTLQGIKFYNFLISLFKGEDFKPIIKFNRPEVEFLDKLEEAFKPFNIKGIRQYNILTYRIDYYIPELKIAIEYDENDHIQYTYEQHELRQKQIEKELSCKFIRVSDNNTDAYNIGMVLKKIIRNEVA